MPLTIKSLSRSGKASSRKQVNMTQHAQLTRNVRRGFKLILPLSLILAVGWINTPGNSQHVLLGELSKACSILVLLSLIRLIKTTQNKKNN
jgi:hypothetical protein